MQPRFDIANASAPPLRAEPRFTAPTDGTGHIEGVGATSGGLIRSTLMAAGGALGILILFWLPAEYGVDPTGVGGLLGLTAMGEIKQQLAGEAAAQDAAALAAPAVAPGVAAAVPAELSDRLARIEARLEGIAAVIGADILVAAPAAFAAPAPTAPAAPEAAPATAEPAPPPSTEGWRDELVFSLAPSESKEIKLEMAAGNTATFDWVSEGGGVNYTQHGDDGGANEVRFEDGRAAPGQSGTMTAPFAGKHGWFWRNRGDGPVTVTLRVTGAYARLIEVQ